MKKMRTNRITWVTMSMFYVNKTSSLKDSPGGKIPCTSGGSLFSVAREIPTLLSSCHRDCKPCRVVV